MPVIMVMMMSDGVKWHESILSQFFLNTKLRLCPTNQFHEQNEQVFPKRVRSRAVLPPSVRPSSLKSGPTPINHFRPVKPVSPDFHTFPSKDEGLRELDQTSHLVDFQLLIYASLFHWPTPAFAWVLARTLDVPIEQALKYVTQLKYSQRSIQRNLTLAKSARSDPHT